MRVGTVAIVGRTNVGKSTFLNACLGERIAIVSPLPQTTRDDLLGVVHRPDAQIAFTDTPGFHRPKTELGRRMNQTALESVRSHDAVVFMTDTGQGRARRRLTKDQPEELGPIDPIHPDDRRLLQLLPTDTPCILVINKVDLLRDKSRLLPLMAAFGDAFSFTAVVPTSMRSADGVDRVLAEVEALLKEGKAPFTEDDITDKPMSFFVREYVREQIMHCTAREVPHAIAVSVERYDDKGKLARIQATIHVEKAGQRIIIVGHKGERIKEIGIGARQRLEELLGKQVHLELFVRVTERWKDVPRQLQELGYEGGGGRDLRSVLPREQRPPKRQRPAAGATARGQKQGASGQRQGNAGTADLRCSPTVEHRRRPMKSTENCTGRAPRSHPI
jgi:GTP-binding protein Era